MSKTRKVFTIIFIVLAVLILAGLIVAIIVYPTQSKEYYDKFVNLLTQPLPIVGVSAVVLIGGILAIISRTSFGKKTLKKMNEEYERLTSDYNGKIEELKQFTYKANDQLQKYKKENDYYKDILLELCDTMPNKKVNAIADKVRLYTSDEFLAEQQHILVNALNGNIEEVNNKFNEMLVLFSTLNNDTKGELLETYEKLKEEYNKIVQESEQLKTTLNKLTTDTIKDYTEKYNSWEWSPFCNKLAEIVKLWSDKYDEEK